MEGQGVFQQVGNQGAGSAPASLSGSGCYGNETKLSKKIHGPLHVPGLWAQSERNAFLSPPLPLPAIVYYVC